MLQRLGFSGFVAVAMVATATLSASAAGKVPADVNVTVTIADRSPDGGYRIQSDTLLNGQYKASATTKVTTKIASNLQGNFWILTTYYTTRKGIQAGDRFVWFDLTEPELANQPAPPITSDFVQAQLVANCYKDGVDLLTMQISAPLAPPQECRGSFRFQTTDGKAFRLAFQPQNYSETDRMGVRCTVRNTANTACNAWTISPIGNRVNPDPLEDRNPKSLVRLVQIDPSSEAILNDQLGNYYVSFFISMTR